MLTLAAGTKVFLATDPVDLRRGHDGLCSLVKNTLGLDAYTDVQIRGALPIVAPPAAGLTVRSGHVSLLDTYAQNLFIATTAMPTWRGIRNMEEFAVDDASTFYTRRGSLEWALYRLTHGATDPVTLLHHDGPMAGDPYETSKFTVSSDELLFLVVTADGTISLRALNKESGKPTRQLANSARHPTPLRGPSM